MTEGYKRRNGNWTRSDETEGKIIAGAIMRWLGITFLLRETNLVGYNSWWPVFAIGMSIIFIAKGIRDYQEDGNWSDASGSFIAGSVFLILGLGSYFSFYNWWPILLIAIGASIIFGAKR